MTKDEFMSLPPSLALGFLYDMHPELADRSVPKVPGPPKFDSRSYRKDGMFVWCSEMQLESLEFWHRRHSESAAQGGQYAEKDVKRAKELEFWIRWRRAFPEQRWSGERDRSRVLAQAPSRDPEQHRADRNGGGSRLDSPPAASQGEFAAPDDDSIPF